MTNTTDTAVTTISSGQVARLVGKTPRTVQRWADLGILPAFRVTPRSPREYRLSDVLALIETPREEGSES